MTSEVCTVLVTDHKLKRVVFKKSVRVIVVRLGFLCQLTLLVENLINVKF